MLPPGDNPQRRAYYAERWQRARRFPLAGRGNRAHRNRTILYGAGTSLAVAALIGSRRFVPRSFLDATGYIPAVGRETKIITPAVRKVRIRMRRPGQLQKGVRTVGMEWNLRQPIENYIPVPGTNAAKHQAFVYDRPVRSSASPLWVGHAEREYLDNPLTGAFTKRHILNQEGLVHGVPPLTRYLTAKIAQQKDRLATLMGGLPPAGGRPGRPGIRLRTEAFEAAFRRLEEDAVRYARKQVKRGVRFFTDSRPPKDAIQAMKRQIRRSDPKLYGEIRRAVLAEHGVLKPDGINFQFPYRRMADTRTQLREALIESRQVADKYLTREAINRLTKDYPSITRRVAEGVVKPFERGIDMANDWSQRQAIALGRKLGLPIDEALANMPKPPTTSAVTPKRKPRRRIVTRRSP